ncbi:hypothetical protein [Desulfobacula toluolica]|uniref:Uncharacterized protein n=1 Tax=Desulfobacula toluolica (strain DSM 7467 / Tol2) TaxID=651182 RepID=K0NL32_DESTT|nr:hypothetical protein [Desulfobacula toluolica]CCK81480.1 uncharacterized protein TOL2_C33230 [Desulfobacula toluolica Tol2]
MKKPNSLWCLLILMFYPAIVFSFSFSEYEKEEVLQEKQQQDKTQKKIDRLLSIACRDDLKEKKIAVIIGQEDGRADYDPLFLPINNELHKLGLKTYSQKQITVRIARAEINAFLSNDMNAAANAAGKLKADFILRGLIQHKTRVNHIVGVNEVSITIIFTLVDEAGRVISRVTEQGESFAGQNTLAAALALVKEKSGLVVARLYNDYCKNSGKQKHFNSRQPAETKPKIESVTDF